MSAADRAVAWALQIAADSKHGYDQAFRQGPDYDCSSLIIAAWEAAGVPVRSAGAGYTGNMLRAFLASGFSDITGDVNLATGAGLLRGDVLLHEQQHTAMYIGGGQIVHASGNERGGATGGVTGDQTGREITTRSYYNLPWQYVLRYDAAEKPQEEIVDEPAIVYAAVPELLHGHQGEAVRALQTLLILRGEVLPAYGADGDFGSETEAAVKTYQARSGLDVDGEVGRRTWAKLIGG